MNAGACRASNGRERQSLQLPELVTKTIDDKG